MITKYNLNIYLIYFLINGFILGGSYKSIIMELNKSLNKTSLDEFLSTVENTLKGCSMVIKKIDKKKDRLLITQHKEKLLEQLQQCHEPALILHLSVLIIFTHLTNSIIHASGKFVAHILQFIKPSLNAEDYQILNKYHGKNSIVFIKLKINLMFFII